MTDGPFVVPQRSAQLLARGATERELGGAAYERRAHGLLLPAGVDGDPVMMRVADAVGLLTTGCVLGGWASLRAQGNTWFEGLGIAGVARPALVHCLPGSQLRHRSAVQPFRGLLHPEEVIDFESFSLTTMARAAFDEMRMAVNLREAVVVLDLATSTTAGLPRTTVAWVEQVISGHHKVRGLVQARDALTWGSTRAASPWETRTRLLARRDADIEGLKVNVPIFSLGGRLLGIADLLDEEAGLVIESDGGHHRENRQHTEDNVREEDFERSGLVVVRVTALDHQQRWRTVGRIAAARRDALHATKREWTTSKPAWWWTWPPARRWDGPTR
ncbi:endonuclease domain-containing protein [Aeromicrobium wangtongii]|uniref:endonuclease domain-containing protein n=1 Tax=Aeromicrobium wangtongii TaxID=2969247 RepID=UPI002016FFE3|nr:endonuclease domain-containing protein [Aeromicrobium wangtongii]MCL3818478.1 endonuclease domain-containing protein [Aeromicrobium wangtongii]